MDSKMALTFGTAPRYRPALAPLLSAFGSELSRRSGATACSKSRATAQLFVALLVEHANESGEPRSCLPVRPHIANTSPHIEREVWYEGQRLDKIWMRLLFGLAR